MLTFVKIGKYGRLGNQMFQIASTIGIALKNGVDFTFPKWKCNYTGNNYEDFFQKKLPVFNVNVVGTINETQFNYYNIITPNKNLCYTLFGFFQTEKYFKEYEDIIKEYFTLKPEIEYEIEKKYQSILKNSCSLHIRRGDYVNQQSHHPIQNLEYYYKGIEQIYGKNIETINFLIFSDDITWCKNNINLPNPHFIEGNTDIVDLFLMSKCDNNIIANSSFSWWGAWLNKNINKKVIGPKKWFGNAIKHNTNDIIPDSWLKI